MTTCLAIKIEQPIGEMYVTALPAGDLVNRVRNSARSSEEEDNQDIQRLFSQRRVRQITEYTEDPDATFPTPIILAVDSNVVTLKPIAATRQFAGMANADKLYEVTLPDRGDVGDVLDGQHRVLGLRESPRRAMFDLQVVMLFDLDPADRAYVFSIINSKQTPVSSSLIYDLFDLSTTSSPRKTCHEVAQALNRDSRSPFFRRLKMLGRREEHHETDVMLSQGTFASQLVDLLASNPDKDARDVKNKRIPLDEPNRPLRKYWLNGDDQSITKILLNYFTAARNAFPEEWDDTDGEYIIRKALGYTALMKVLKEILPELQADKNLTEAAFQERFKVFKRRLEGRPLTGTEFQSSASAATELAEIWLGKRPARGY
jgi:DGQHR domain-containing protein